MKSNWAIPVIDVNKFLLPLGIALLLFSGTLSQTVYAHGLLDQTTTTCPCNSGSFFATNLIRFQEFVPTQNNIVSIEVEIVPLTLSSVNPITVNLRNGDATGAIIGSTTTHTGLPPPNTLGTVHFDFAGPIALTPGNLYTIEMTVNDGSSVFDWFARTGNPYPQGGTWLRQGVNLFGPGDSEDLTLKTYFTDVVIGGTNIPIDQTALLLAGVQSISMWMIPVVIAGIGIGVFVIKRRK